MKGRRGSCDMLGQWRMDRISISRIFDPRHLDRFRTDDLESILVLNGYYPSREDIQRAKEKYGAVISRSHVDEELCRQRKKSPIDVNSLLEDMKAMLRVERGRFLKDDLAGLLCHQGCGLDDQETETLLKGICDNGIVKMSNFIERLTEPNRNVTKARKI